MTVPIDYGMWGWTWDQSGNRTGGQGTHQSILDCGEHAAARDGSVWRPVHRLEPCWRLRPGVVRPTRHVRAAVADCGRRKRRGRDRRRQRDGHPRNRDRDAVPVSGNHQQPEAVSRLAHRGPQLLPGLLHLGVREAEARLPDQRQRGGCLHARQLSVSNPAADADSGWLRAPGAFVRRRRLSISGQHRGVLRQEPRRLLRARGISADHTDALGGMLDAEPSASDRGHAHARRNRRRDTCGMARRANGGMADHACSASATKSGKWCR